MHTPSHAPLCVQAPFIMIDRRSWLSRPWVPPLVRLPLLPVLRHGFKKRSVGRCSTLTHRTRKGVAYSQVHGTSAWKSGSARSFEVARHFPWLILLHHPDRPPICSFSGLVLVWIRCSTVPRRRADWSIGPRGVGVSAETMAFASWTLA